MRKLRGQAHWLCQSPGGLPPLRQARTAPAQRNQANPFCSVQYAKKPRPKRTWCGKSAAYSKTFLLLGETAAQ